MMQQTPVVLDVDGSVGPLLQEKRLALAQWQEPSGREGLTGSALASGPGTGGSGELWRFGADPVLVGR